MKNVWEKYRSCYRSIIRLGGPILVGQLGMIVVAFADNIMVGRYSTGALASASFVNNLFNIANFACIGFTYGLTPLVGALFSRGEYRTIGGLLRNGLAVNLVFALGVMAVMAAIYLNVDRLAQPAELLPLIRPYYLIVMAGMLPVALFNVFAQWLFAINRTALPMWIVLVSNVINIAGNYVLIYGHCGAPAMGLTGAGYSTLIARVFCLVAVMVIFFTAGRFGAYREGLVEGRCNRRTAGQVFTTSYPVSLQMTFESGSFGLAAVMAGWLGAISLASFQIIMITGTLGFCVYYSVGAAVSVLVANRAGLSDRAGMRRYAFAGYHIILLLATVSSLVFILGGRFLIGAFTEDPVLIGATMGLLLPLVVYQYGDATQIIFANALRGTSHVMPMLWIALFCYVVVGIPATYLLGFPAGLGTFGIILSFSVSLFLAAGLFLYYFLRATRR